MTGTPRWVRDLQFTARRMATKLPNRHFSTFGEQEIIDKYVRELGITNNCAVDIGAGDGIRGSNTYHLFQNGWRGLGIEADAIKYGRLRQAYSGWSEVKAFNALVQPDTICSLLRSNGIENDLGVLSLDIDGNDYWVLDAILSEFRPQLVVSEYNEKIPPPIRFVVDYDPDFRLRHHFFGYSIAKLPELLRKYDYALLEVEYNNVFLAPAELAGERARTPAEAYSTGYLDRPDRREKFATNQNMEVLHTLDPRGAVDHLNDFYSEHRGKYQIDIAEDQCAA